MISQDIFEKFKQFENLKNSLGEIKVVQLKKYFNYCQLTQNVANYFSQFYTDR